MNFLQDEFVNLPECKKQVFGTTLEPDLTTHLGDIYRLSTFSCDIPTKQLSKADFTKRNTKEPNKLKKIDQLVIQRVLIFTDEVSDFSFGVRNYTVYLCKKVHG